MNHVRTWKLCLSNQLLPKKSCPNASEIIIRRGAMEMTKLTSRAPSVDENGHRNVCSVNYSCRWKQHLRFVEKYCREHLGSAVISHRHVRRWPGSRFWLLYVSVLEVAGPLIRRMNTGAEKAAEPWCVLRVHRWRPSSTQIRSSPPYTFSHKKKKLRWKNYFIFHVNDFRITYIDEI